MNKPHMFAKQNELIQQMLNKDKESSTNFSQTFSQKSNMTNTTGAGFRQPVIGKQDSTITSNTSQTGSNVASKTGYSNSINKKRQVGGSAQKTKEPVKSQNSELFTFKMPDSYKDNPVPSKGKPIVPPREIQSAKTKQDGEEDIEDVLISDKRLEKQEKESYKNSFLTKIFENTDFNDDNK